MQLLAEVVHYHESVRFLPGGVKHALVGIGVALAIAVIVLAAWHLWTRRHRPHH